MQILISHGNYLFSSVNQGEHFDLQQVRLDLDVRGKSFVKIDNLIQFSNSLSILRTLKSVESQPGKTRVLRCIFHLEIFLMNHCGAMGPLQEIPENSYQACARVAFH